MKNLRFLLALAFTATWSLPAQEPPPEEPSAFPAVILTPEQLEQLLAPIALYPDALIALILPAATVPTDIVLAARYLKENPGNLSQVEHRAWDDSVKSLTHYPDVLKWLDENLTWTRQLGEAFAAQPAEVMNAIQRLRARARASGTLTDTPQQQVVADPQVIRIVPADPEIIYVPRYDPAVVFVERPYYYTSAPLLTFGVGWRVGSWLAYDFDWHRCTLWVGDRHRHWQPRHDWRRPLVPIGPAPRGHTYVHPPARPWQPPARLHRPPNAPSYRSHPQPPANTGTLARTYGRTHSPVAPRADRPPPSVTPSPTPVVLEGVSRIRPPDSHPRSQATVAVSSPAPGTTPQTNRRGWYRDATRTAPNSNQATPGSRIAPVAPSLSVVGPISSVRPTVVAPAPTRPSGGHLGHPSGGAPVNSRPMVSPRGSARTYAAPAPPPPAPAQVAPPAPALTQSEAVSATAPGRSNGHGPRPHTRRSEQP